METVTSFKTIQQELAQASITCSSLVENFLTSIEAKKEFNIFLEVFADEAKERALQIDQKIANGTAGRLAGMVIAIKDNICYKGHVVSAASKILDNFSSLYSATAIERLLAEDVIIIGRVNCDEFAMGGSNENSGFGNTLNPLNPSLVPGGSSGGSAAAVAAGLCHAALGSDTGGSIRQPASFCGIVGLKPSYGRISRYGLIAYASSFDQIGPLTTNVEDAGLLLEIMSGEDQYDSSVSRLPVPDYSNTLPLEGKLKIAYIKECFENPALDPEIKTRLLGIIQLLKEKGHIVEEMPFPLLDYLVPAYYVLTTAEASSNLSRYGGVTYGYRSKNATDIDSTFKKSRTEGFGEEVKRRIMLGTFVLSAAQYDAYYSKAQKVRRLICEKTSAILTDYSFILIPTTPSTAFAIGEIKDPLTMYLEDIFTVHANLTGLPAISLPLGKHSNGMPFGIQLIGNSFEEKNLLTCAEYLTNIAK
jgi:aspartyl-tRNA(Asn)/glutamyl-tRNA(Gln) amidotransferase subunit A